MTWKGVLRCLRHLIALAADGEDRLSGAHPRAYGNVARLLVRYVRDAGVITLEQAIHRLTLLPAQTLSVPERGRLAPGFYADITIFDPDTIEDRATFENAHQYATGIRHVLVNGIPVIADAKPTGATPGRAVRGPGWVGHKRPAAP